MTEKQLKNKVFPYPKKVWAEDGLLDLRSCRVAVETEAKTAAAAAELIAKYMTLSDNAAAAVTLRMGEAPAEVSFPDQAYEVAVTADGVTLTGFGDRGLYYAAVTFVQLLENGQAPLCRILDWPDMEFRGHQIECRLGSDVMEEQDWYDVIDDLAMQKINHLNPNIYGCWVGQYDNRVSEYLYVPIEGHPELQTPFPVKYYDAANRKWVNEYRLTPMFEKDFFGRVVAYAAAWGMKVYPGFNSYGHNTLIPRTNHHPSAKSEDGTPNLTGWCTANPMTYELWKRASPIRECSPVKPCRRCAQEERTMSAPCCRSPVWPGRPWLSGKKLPPILPAISCRQSVTSTRPITIRCWWRTTLLCCA